jgi:hypothetical protein
MKPVFDRTDTHRSFEDTCSLDICRYKFSYDTIRECTSVVSQTFTDFMLADLQRYFQWWNPKTTNTHRCSLLALQFPHSDSRPHAPCIYSIVFRSCLVFIAIMASWFLHKVNARSTLSVNITVHKVSYCLYFILDYKSRFKFVL